MDERGMDSERTKLLEKTVKTFDSIERGDSKILATEEPTYTTIVTPSRYKSEATAEGLRINQNETNDEKSRPSSSSFPFKFSLLNGFIVLICFTIPFFIFHLLDSYQKTPETFDSSSILPDGAKIQLFSPSAGLYLRTDTSQNPSSSAGKETKIIADHSFPWLHGSTFEVSRSNNECFQLRSMKKLWLKVGNGGDLVADGASWLEGEYFALQPTQEDQLTGDNKIYYRLKVCNYDYFFGSYQTRRGSFSVKLTTNSFLSRKRSWFNHAATTTDDSLRFETSFEVKHVKPLLGVNLGGWFIPEYWMNPSFYNSSGLMWASSLCTLKNKYPKLAEKTMLKHLETWITETDLKQIAALGFNSIRLPIGYWNIIDDPYNRYIPSNVNVSLAYLDWLFDKTDELKISVLVDLHGAPGSQNAQDHSGCLYLQQFTYPQNLDLALQSIETIMQKYSKRKSFLGIELLNEPNTAQITVKQHSLLIHNYYEKAYRIIRKYHKSCYIMINELEEKAYHLYANDLQEPVYYNVIMDYHLYNWQDPYESNEKHMAEVHAWEKMIDDYTIQHPIVVGEWSMSTGIISQIGQKFVDASIQSFTKSFGWYMWNWKVERDPRFDAWDVQYQMITKGGFNYSGTGYNPFHYYQEYDPEALLE